MTSREPESDAEDDDDAPAPVVAAAGRPRWGLGLVAIGAGVLLGLLAVISPVGPRTAVPLGLFAALLVAKGACFLLGTFADTSAGPTITLRRLAPGLAATALGALATLTVLRLAVAGTLGPIGTGVLLPIAFLAAVSGVGSTLGALDLFEDTRPFYRREGFWLIAFATLVLLPSLGAKSLTDPWETHYGEVSREILARRDWISLWWAHEGWFWSKPILSFWMQALGMATFGAGFEPGQMLEGAKPGVVAWPEWSVRFPYFLVALGSTYVLYKAVAASFGRRAGLIGGVVLTTMPQWFFLAHQTMTDMPFVAGMSAALGFFLLGASTPGDRLVRVRKIEIGATTISVSARQLLVGVVVVLVAPQIIYLLAQNVALNLDPVVGLRVPPIRFVEDTFSSGSGGNCGVMPGNRACQAQYAFYPRVRPAVQALFWATGLAAFLYLQRGERRARRLHFLAAFVCAALATMGKGPAAVVVPFVAVAGYLVVTRRWALLVDLEIASGILVLGTICLPWFVAMFVRHGQGFVDRLLFHDMYKRAFEHVHDTNKNDDVSFRYYVWQLGYATFPWVAWIPAALARAWSSASGSATEDDDAARDRSGTIALLSIWFVATFALFSYMRTKFHHYVFPAVPPLALLVGLAIDSALGSARDPRSSRHDRAVFAMSAATGALLVFIVGKDFAVARPDQPSDARLLHLFTYQYERTWPANLSFSGWFWGFAIAATAAALFAASVRLRRVSLAAFAGVATLFAVWSLDLYFPRVSPHWGQRELVLRYRSEAELAPGVLVAYQMNWKGENFYTSNQLATFVESGAPFREWIGQQRKAGHKTFYFVLLPNRIRSLESELPEAKELSRLTTPEENNKFALVRARF